MSPATSLSLLDRLAQADDATAWQRWFDLYQPLLLAWARRAGLDQADADDVVQDTLTVVVREVAAFDRRRPGAFRAWLRTILAHRLARHFEQRGRRAAGGSDLAECLHELEDPASGLSAEWDREHDRWLAHRALRLVEADFTAAAWQAFRRQVFDGRRAAAVAEELGLSVNAVLMAKSRVLKRLRQELATLVEAAG